MGEIFATHLPFIPAATSPPSPFLSLSSRLPSLPIAIPPNLIPAATALIPAATPPHHRHSFALRPPCHTSPPFATAIIPPSSPLPHPGRPAARPPARGLRAVDPGRGWGRAPPRAAAATQAPALSEIAGSDCGSRHLAGPGRVGTGRGRESWRVTKLINSKSSVLGDRGLAGRLALVERPWRGVGW